MGGAVVPRVRLNAQERAALRLAREQMQLQRDAIKAQKRMAWARVVRDALTSRQQAQATNPFITNVDAALLGATVSTLGGLLGRAQSQFYQQLPPGKTRDFFSLPEPFGDLNPHRLNPLQLAGNGIMLFAAANQTAGTAKGFIEAIRGPGAQSSSLAFDVADGGEAGLQVVPIPPLPFVAPPQGGGGAGSASAAASVSAAEAIAQGVGEVVPVASPQSAPQAALVGYTDQGVPVYGSPYIAAPAGSQEPSGAVDVVAPLPPGTYRDENGIIRVPVGVLNVPGNEAPPLVVPPTAPAPRDPPGGGFPLPIILPRRRTGPPDKSNAGDPKPGARPSPEPTSGTPKSPAKVVYASPEAPVPRNTVVTSAPKAKAPSGPALNALYGAALEIYQRSLGNLAYQASGAKKLKGDVQ